jgi:hypothetical protein
VHVTRRAPSYDGAPPIFLGGFIEASNRTRRHVARRSRLMIVGGTAAIGRPAGRTHIITCALQEHDRQPYHFGMAKHVATEPECDAIRA